MKRNLIILLCLLLGLSWYMAISEAVNNPKKAREHVENAKKYEEQGIYVDAVTEYEEALKYQPDDIDISLKMAKAYLNTGNSKKFTSIRKELAESRQDSAKALDCLMNYYVENKEEPSAVKYLGEFLETYPKNESAQKWMLQLKGSYQTLFCRYDELGNIVFETMVVSKDEKKGVANSKGEEILEPAYEEVYPFSDSGLALLKKDGTYIYVDQDGQTRLVDNASYEMLGMMYSDRTTAFKEGQYTYLDEKLQPVTELSWDQLTQIAQKTGAGKKDGKWALLDKNGKEITEYIYDDVSMDEFGFCSMQKRIFVKETGKYHMVDTKGKTVGELQFDEAYPFSDEGAYAAVCMNGKWGFTDTEGKLVIECSYEDARSFSNGFAAVCMDNKWGYIDETGYMIIEPQFEFASAISAEGTAAVFSDEWELIQLNLFR